ncbi:MAG TPA: hypothetical protein VGR20_23090, partial [Acidimicrobiia bacterium]|nr:hypothetical protein [Acidimicrobiia bacterium]
MTDRTITPSRPEGRSINRRQALAGLGGLGLSALLVACGKDSPSDTGATGSTTADAAGSTATSAATGTTAAGSASADVASLLEGAGSCAVVAELTEGPYYIDIDKVRTD